ncbi:MAG TPA: transglutaminase domain-containing protein [Ferruginibacter sp.]|nr:transglutaminase domain-containing protein [Ferruginibacter sp.]
MNYFFKRSILLLFTCIPFILFAQNENRDFKAVDDYVKSLGSLQGMSMGTINNVVSKKFEDKIDRARAIYYWIANNISYDIKAARSNNKAKNTPTEVLLSRRAVGIGFAGLFQDMCSSADIRCLTVDGFIKNTTEDIEQKGTEINHSWAVVQLGLSPDTWYYVDPALGSGYPDGEMKAFTKSYSDAYFFTDKATFNLQHYPDNESWKLGSAPKNKRDFYALPLVKVAAQEFGLKRLSPNDGILKVKAGKSINFNYTLNSNEEISKVAMAVGEKKKLKVKDMNYSYSGGALSFTYKFEEDGAYPIMIMIDGKEFVGYAVEVE